VSARGPHRYPIQVPVLGFLTSMISIEPIFSRQEFPGCSRNVLLPLKGKQEKPSRGE
jgi:hypothetical protein